MRKHNDRPDKSDSKSKGVTNKVVKRRALKSKSKLKPNYDALIIGASTSGLIIASELADKGVKFQVIDPFPIEMDLPLLLTYDTVKYLTLTKSEAIKEGVLSQFFIKPPGTDDHGGGRLDKILVLTNWLSFIDYFFQKLPPNSKPKLNVRVKNLKRVGELWEVETNYRTYRVRYLVLAIDFYPKSNISKVIEILEKLNLADKISYPMSGFLKVVKGKLENDSDEKYVEMELLSKNYGYAINVLLNNTFASFLYNLNVKPQVERKWQVISNTRLSAMNLRVEEESGYIPLPISIGFPFLDFSSLPENLILVGEIIGSSNPIFLYNVGANIRVIQRYAELISRRVIGEELRKRMREIYNSCVLENNRWAIYLANLLFKYPLITYQLFKDKKILETFRSFLRGREDYRGLFTALSDKASSYLGEADVLKEMEVFNYISAFENFSIFKLAELVDGKRKVRLRQLTK